MLDFAKTVLAKLVEAQVEFVVVGGVSAVLQGVPITTVDLDVCYRRTPENIARLASVVAAFNARLRDFPAELPFTLDARAIQLGSNFTLEIGDESLDLLGTMSAIGGYEDIIDQAQDVLVNSMTVKALSLDQLITTKAAAGRPKDFATIPIIRATLEMKKLQEGSQ
jgi:predicted nucleotidyltransferase